MPERASPRLELRGASARWPNDLAQPHAGTPNVSHALARHLHRNRLPLAGRGHRLAVVEAGGELGKHEAAGITTRSDEGREPFAG